MSPPNRQIKYKKKIQTHSITVSASHIALKAEKRDGEREKEDRTKETKNETNSANGKIP